MAFDRRAHRRFASWLAAAFSIYWLLLAIAPVDREVWLLENVLTALAIVALVVTFNRLTLSRISYASIALFLAVHTLGSHYTYSLTPYDAFLQSWLGISIDQALGFERNHYDRFVHFSFGLLLAYPAREVLLRVAQVRGFWGYMLPLMLTLSCSTIYELIEWGAAMVFGGDLGMDYVGTQGDIWDAHKDTSLALLGAVSSITIVAVVNLRLQRDFHAEWVESLRVKHQEPLGEHAVRAMIEARESH